MKILHTVESYLPSRHGMQEVVSQLSENLVKKGHDVTIATGFDKNRKSSIINGVKIASFKIDGNFVDGVTGEAQLYVDFLKDGNFDIVTNFAAQQWATDLMLPVLNELKAKKVFVPTGFSGLNNPAYKAYFENMKTWMKSYDAHVFLSDNYRDINFAKENSIYPLFVIPNGANETEFENAKYVDIKKLLNLPASTRLLLTVGTHTGFKGHDVVIKIFEQARIDNCALLIIGNKVNPGSHLLNFIKGVLNFAGLRKTNCYLNCKMSAAKFNLTKKRRTVFVREFGRNITVNAFKQADLFLFPSLIECSPLVLFEAMAGSTPFLVSDVGNATEIIKWTNGGKLLPTKFDAKGYSRVKIDESAKLIKELLGNSYEMQLYRNSGNNAFLQKFTWEKIAKQYEELYLKLIQ